MLKINEGAEIYYQSNEYQKSNSLNRFDNIFEAGVKFAQRWIPVEEELPEIGEKVQVKLLIEIIGHKTTDIDHDRLILKDGKTWMFDVEQVTGIAVTHWRPIELK